jgi:AmmeMemoRadiSam system protein A
VIDSPKGGDEMLLNKEQRKKMLETVRSVIETYLKTGQKPDIKETDPVLIKTMGAFVTLHKKGELRGCIGNIVGTQPLYLTIRDMAIESSTGDPRFPKVTLDELKDIDIEISVLSPLEKVKSAEDIVLGKHGVLVRRGLNSGVFLPQVADETGWSRDEFLSYLCAHKAGLPSDAWKDKKTELFVFTAEVFSEKEY